MDIIKIYVDNVMRTAKESKGKGDLRTGQVLFNGLPLKAGQTFIQTAIDPFYKELQRYEVVEWVCNHLILDGDDSGVSVIGVFEGNKILWEEEPPDMAVPALVI